MSDVIYAFKKALSPSNTLFSILGDLADEGSAVMTSWSFKSTSSTGTGEVVVLLLLASS